MSGLNFSIIDVLDVSPKIFLLNEIGCVDMPGNRSLLFSALQKICCSIF
jgi:hypothetical protein